MFKRLVLAAAIASARSPVSPYPRRVHPETCSSASTTSHRRSEGRTGPSRSTRRCGSRCSGPTSTGATFSALRGTRPVNPTNPADPAYDWSVYDRTSTQAKANRIKVVFSILWTPRWAGPRKERRRRRRMADLRNFAFAAAKRYSGSFTPIPDASRCRPCATGWPGTSRTTRSSSRRSSGRSEAATSPSARASTRRCATRSGRASNLTGLRNKVACGVTAPRGNNSGAQPRPSLSPISFLRGMKEAGGALRRLRAPPVLRPPHRDADARPTVKGRRRSRSGTSTTYRSSALYGNKRLWITEYGYQTTRPDRLFGVSLSAAGALPHPGVRDRPAAPADRHDDLVPAQGRAAYRRRLAVRASSRLRLAQAELHGVPARQEVTR